LSEKYGGVSLKDVDFHVSLSERYGSVLLSMKNMMAVSLSMENMMAVCLSAYECYSYVSRMCGVIHLTFDI